MSFGRVPFVNVVALWMFASFSGATLIAQTAAKVSYQKLRQDENWSSLSSQEPKAKRDLFEPIKYVPVNESGSVWMSFGGHVRLRGEKWSNYNFRDEPPARDTYGLGRVHLHADIQATPHVRLFVEGHAALATDRKLPGGRRPSDVDEGDLLNAFVDVSTSLSDSSKVTFRAGRQQLLFGKERLVGPSTWSNSIRTFEGFSGKVQVPGWSLTGFWVMPIAFSKFSFNRRDASTDFFGVYATGRVPTTKVGWEVYWLGLDRMKASFNGTSGAENRHTLGTRLWGAIPESNFDYEFESAYQFGEIGTDGISAQTAMGQLGYGFPELPGTPRVYSEVDYASGDKRPGGDVQTYNRLFPTAHANLGFADMIGWQNVVDVIGGLTVKPLKTVALDASVHNFWRATEDDAFYTTSGSALRLGAEGFSKRVGWEIDWLLKYTPSRHTEIGVGFSQFFPGQFVEQTGPAANLSFAYVWTQYTF